MLSVWLLIDAYGLKHKTCGFWNKLCGWVDIFDDEACLKVLQEAKGRDIVRTYPKDSMFYGGSVCGGEGRAYEGEIDPDFDFEKFVAWVEENEEEIIAKIDQQ